MELKVGSLAEYTVAVRKLLPPGDYWENQIATADSDISLAIEAKAELIVSIRSRMSQLLKEAYPATAEETIEDWERVYLGTENSQLPLENRRALVMSNSGYNAIHTIADSYGVTLQMIFPFSVGCFGNARFGQSRTGSQAVLSVILVYITGAADISSVSNFEAAVSGLLLANQIVYFIYTFTDSTSFNSMSELSNTVKKTISADYIYTPAQFGGVSRFGRDRISAPFAGDTVFVEIPGFSSVFRRKDIEGAVKSILPAYAKICFIYGSDIFYVGYKADATDKTFSSLTELNNTTGVTVTVESELYRPAPFGASVFGQWRISSPQGADVIKVTVPGYGRHFRRKDIETAVKKLMPQNAIIYFVYGKEVIYG